MSASYSADAKWLEGGYGEITALELVWWGCQEYVSLQQEPVDFSLPGWW